jgi:hypothetical protein
VYALDRLQPLLGQPKRLFAITELPSSPKAMAGLECSSLHGSGVFPQFSWGHQVTGMTHVSDINIIMPFMHAIKLVVQIQSRIADIICSGSLGPKPVYEAKARVSTTRSFESRVQSSPHVIVTQNRKLFCIACCQSRHINAVDRNVWLDSSCYPMEQNRIIWTGRRVDE